jgi:beta-glucosidase-like glycosyl hydrolase
MLRNDLGFEGLVLTDALTMHALDDIPDVPVHCLNAGVDILLHPADPEEAVNTLLSAVLSGHLSEERIDRSLDRIMMRKESLRDMAMKDIDYQTHARLSSQISNKSVSLIKGVHGVVPLNKGENLCIVIAGDQELSLRSPLKNLSPNIWTLQETGHELNLHNVTTIVAIFTSIAAWKGSSGINADEKERIHAITKNSRTSIVISFGNPFVLRYFPEVDVLIAAYEASDQSQETVMKWLTGSGELKGKIPVRLF